MNKKLLVIMGVGIIAALGIMVACNSDETTGPSVVVSATPAPTPDPCQCDHGTVEVYRNGVAVTRVAPHERGVAKVTAWFNTSGDQMTLAACQWAGKYNWSARGGGCAFRGDTSQATAEFVCTIPTLSADPALLKSTANVHGRECVADFNLAVEWD